jgi:hypothetical protein
MTFFTEATMSAIVTIYDNRFFSTLSLPSGSSFNRTEWSISVSPIGTRTDGKTLYEEIAVITKEIIVQPSTTIPNPDATVLPITTTRKDALLSKLHCFFTQDNPFTPSSPNFC